ncbi:hypothetical protein QWY87_13610 [Lutimonas halocynthiae]|uniref:hypothetical protein n=1 Tax=Lutimonas halocynthiae TaxID=1446477 RepID=UPI0025B38C1D|nr:hypothetical protein [Lutimonas halocynthiae]MDN3643748.1 hypothetical protein [Lutimonas halocynthiae]
MKKVAIVFISILFFTSCQKSPEEKMKENITLELKQIMNDPSTFEFVSMEIKKTIKAGERKKTMNEAQLKRFTELGMTDLINQSKQEIPFLKNLDDDYDAVFYVDFVARGSNKFGGIITNKYSATVLNDENRTVVHFKPMN